jgi:hypothetical protein
VTVGRESVRFLAQNRLCGAPAPEGLRPVVLVTG